jgi:hypothetical protein
MPGLFKPAAPTPEQRRRHDRHRPAVVLAVLAVLAAYAYLFTAAPAQLGLPAPGALARRAGLHAPEIFRPDGQVACALDVFLGGRPGSADRERLALLGCAALVFVLAYFAPVARKRPVLVCGSLGTLAILYGPATAAGLLLAHGASYLAFHPVGRARRWLAGRPRAARALRTLVAQSALLTVGASAVVEGAIHRTWDPPVFLLLFFWQWERLILYHVDLQDGAVPERVPFATYLSVFLTPGAIPTWNWGVTIGQGYAYCESGFLAEDKNRLALAGLRLWGLALLYLTLSGWATERLVALFTGLGIPVHEARTANLVAHFSAGGAATTATVLATTFLDLLRWLMLWGGIVHFKVGLWRVCGYRTDPYFDRPWMATNLVAFWARFTFHYREFLARAFYYPVFFRCFRRARRLRILAATLAATTVGNLIWGHVTERLYYRGLELRHALAALRTWPYFLLLGLGITATELFLLRRRQHARRPWTPGLGLLGDVAAAYATMQLYALITIFARPAPASTLGDLARLFLLGLGIGAR